MPYGTVEWLNTKTGVGLIRTDDGENVSFLNSAIQDSDTSSSAKIPPNGLSVSMKSSPS